MPSNPPTNKITSVHPIEGALTTLPFIMDAMMGNQPHRNDVFTDNWDNIVVDTVCAPDTSVWETGIAVDGNSWVIVSQYPDKESAQKGHAEWVKSMKENPKRSLKDIDNWNLHNEEDVQ